MSERTRFTAWITKYALSTGIQQLRVEDCFDISEHMVSVLNSQWSQYFHGEGKDWHRTREGAQRRAEAMRVAKIASLQKQISKLENLKFI